MNPHRQPAPAGRRYLMMLDDFDGMIYTKPGLAAEITEGEVISAIPAERESAAIDFGVFMPYDGMTVGEIRDMVSRINSYGTPEP